MALTPAEKQKAYRDRERRKLELLRKAASKAALQGNVTAPRRAEPQVKARSATKPALEDWDAAEVLEWFENATEDEREEFVSGLRDLDLHDLLLAAAEDDFHFNGNYADWLYSVGLFEDTGYVRLPKGVNLDELDKWLRSKYGEGLDKDDLEQSLSR